MRTFRPKGEADCAFPAPLDPPFPPDPQIPLYPPKKNEIDRRPSVSGPCTGPQSAVFRVNLLLEEAGVPLPSPAQIGLWSKTLGGIEPLLELLGRLIQAGLANKREPLAYVHRVVMERAAQARAQAPARARLKPRNAASSCAPPAPTRSAAQQALRNHRRQDSEVSHDPLELQPLRRRPDRLRRHSPKTASATPATTPRRRRAAFTEADAGIPERYRGLTRESWSAHFQRPWPEALERWTGTPHWLALWGPTGTGKTGLATVLLAEHLRTGRRGRWISGPELARRIQRDFTAAEDVIAPLLVTSAPRPRRAAHRRRRRLVHRAPDAHHPHPRRAAACPPSSPASSSPSCSSTRNAAAPPPLLSRWLSGLHIHDESAAKTSASRRAL